MKISRKSDYALRAVRHLSTLPKGELGSINSIAEAEAVPREFLAKILKDLTRAGLLVSYQGVKGGYSLSGSPKNVSFLDVIEAIDGPIQLNLCTGNGTNCGCDSANSCDMRKFWQTQERIYKRALSGQKFSQYTRGRRRR